MAVRPHYLLDKTCYLFLSDSCPCEACPRHRRFLYVSRLVYSSLVDSRSHLTSWEFIVNLDYEYSIIAGHRKINWSARVSVTSPLMIWEVLIP
jgi:hypothetical protein